MFIKNVSIKWWEGYINYPEIILTVDKVPEFKSEDFLSKRLAYESPHGTLYWATHKSGYTHQYFVEDSSAKHWSSRASILNAWRCSGGPFVDVTINNYGRSFRAWKLEKILPLGTELVCIQKKKVFPLWASAAIIGEFTIIPQKIKEENK